eukprot:jgi/Astpho2/1148/fgenesh1_pg.00021_%23_10_t
MDSQDSQDCLDDQDEAHLTFHGVSYKVVTAVHGDRLCVEVEQADDASRWRGEFSAHYVEDITAKTGNFKKYAVFVKMLLAALRQGSDSVFVDLLTYADLEVLKSKRGPGHPPLQQTIPPNNKRYLILTYAAEFDRVHYPLPLQHQEPSVERLQKVVRQLRLELQGRAQDGWQGSLKGAQRQTQGSGQLAPAEVRRLREENAVLRQQLSKVDPQAGHVAVAEVDRLTAAMRETSRELRLVCKERDLLQQRAEAAEAELARERSMHRRELRRRAKELADAHQELLQDGTARRAETMGGSCASRSSSWLRRWRQRSVGAEGCHHLPGQSTPAGSRPSSTERPARLLSDTLERLAQPKQPVVRPRSRTSSTERLRRESPARPSIGTAGRGASRWRDEEQNLPPQPAPGKGMPRREERASSPGRALQEVKSKLNQFTANVVTVQPGPAPNATVFTAPSEPAGAEDGTDVDDASAEIADIDSRLQALQSFLKAAKAGTPV